MGLLGIEKLHPFDSKKYGRVWALAHRATQGAVEARTVPVDRSISETELERVHTRDYLDALRSSAVVAEVLELPPLRLVPSFLLRRQLLEPMRLATRGTCLAGELALEYGVAVNLSGGYHHAKPDGGEGFCVFNDIAVMVAHLRDANLLAPEATILYVDLDAHMGDGVAHAFMEDARVVLLDIYNAEIYPHDPDAQHRIDVDLGLKSGTTGEPWISVSSEVGVFTEFRIVLPQATDPDPPITAASQATARARPRVLIVVDHEPTLRRALVGLLQREHELREADSLAEAQALIRAEPAFDVILSDVGPPDALGIELHRWLTGRAAGLAGRMIFLAGRPSLGGDARYLAQVPNLILSQPPQAKRLMDEIAFLVGGA